MWISGFKNQTWHLLLSVYLKCCASLIVCRVLSLLLSWGIPTSTAYSTLLSVDHKGWCSQDHNQSLTFLRALKKSHIHAIIEWPSWTVMSVRDGTGIRPFFPFLLIIFMAISLAIFWLDVQAFRLFSVESFCYLCGVNPPKDT